MSLAKKSFSAAIAAPLALAFGLASNDAHADVSYGCRKPSEVPALTRQVLEQEGMEPVARRLTHLDEKSFLAGTIMVNPKTGNGLLWQKFNDGTVCIYTKYEQAEIFSHTAFDNRAFVSIANQDPRSIPINLRIANASVTEKQNPMFRAIATSPTNAAKNDPVRYPTRYVEYMTGNPTTERGSVFAAALDGKILEDFTKVIPAKGEPGVQYGASFTPFGENILKSRIASLGAPTTVALNRN